MLPLPNSHRKIVTNFPKKLVISIVFLEDVVDMANVRNYVDLLVFFSTHLEHQSFFHHTCCQLKLKQVCAYHALQKLLWGQTLTQKQRVERVEELKMVEI